MEVKVVGRGEWGGAAKSGVEPGTRFPAPTVCRATRLIHAFHGGRGDGEALERGARSLLLTTEESVSTHRRRTASETSGFDTWHKSRTIVVTFRPLFPFIRSVLRRYF